MAENSKIGWTDDTLNIWIGCNPVRFAVTLEQAKLLEQDGHTVVIRNVNGHTMYFLPSECDNCLVPETPILYADLTWRAMGNVQVGDLLVGFDEHSPAPGRRRWQPSVVEAVVPRLAQSWRLITERSEVWATADHRWLSDHDWQRTAQLDPHTRKWALRNVNAWGTPPVSDDYRAGYLAGLTLGDGTYRYVPGQRSDKLGWPQPYWRVALTDEEPIGRAIAYLAHFGIAAASRPFNGGNLTPMTKVEIRALDKLAVLDGLLKERGGLEYGRGFLAGFFDAEGSWSGALRYWQKDRSALELVQRYAAGLGFRFDLYPPSDGYVAHSARLVGRTRDQLAFLGTIQPAIARKRGWFWGKSMQAEEDPVLAIEPGPMVEVLDIQTSTSTFLANGLATHNCYADVWSRRRFEKAQNLPRLWGNPKETPRYQVKDWRSKLRHFNQLAMKGGRRLCFAESLSDIGEEHAMVAPWRNEFMPLAASATYVDFLMLTKRPQNMLRIVPQEWLRNWPQNVWLGYSAGTDRSIEVRAHYATEWRSIGVPVVFVSVEPHLEDLDIGPAINDGANWIITGGESGDGEERERIDANPDWFRRVRDTCLEAGVAYFHKQGSASRAGQFKELDGRLWHQWPDTSLGSVGGVRASEAAELIHIGIPITA